MKRLLVSLSAFAFVLSFGLFTPEVTQAQAPENVTWNVQYYNNPFLLDPPVVDTEYTGKIDFEWGFGSPDPAVQVDNFSARYGALVHFEPGTYRFSLRADDQARISINEQSLLSTLNGGQVDQTLTADIYLEGAHQLQIDYREFSGIAYLQVNWQNVATIGQPEPGAPVATVRVATLNVRNAPTTINSEILTRVNAGQNFGIVGRNADSSWLQINANGVIGWVFAPLVNAVNLQAVPVVGGQEVSPPPAADPTQFVATAVANLNLRSEPVIGDNRIRVLPAGTNATILGRNADTSWLLVEVDGTRGWVAFNFVRINPPLRLDEVPVL